MKKNNFKLILNLFLVLTMISIIQSCIKEEPLIEGDHDAVSGVILYARDTNNNLIDSFRYVDYTGTGNFDNATKDTVNINDSTSYNFTIKLVNVVNNVITDVTDEIQELSFEHQFYFTPSINNLTISYLDQDKNGLPIGLSTRWRTTNASNGTVRILLKHLPDGLKTAGDNTAKGSTDIDLSYTLKIK